MSTRAKSPRAPYWQALPQVAEDGRGHEDPEHFVGTPIVTAEKPDGGNWRTCAITGREAREGGRR